MHSQVNDICIDQEVKDAIQCTVWWSRTVYLLYLVMCVVIESNAFHGVLPSFKKRYFDN